MKRLLAVPLVIIISLAQQACTQAQILIDLDFASVAFAAVANVQGIPPIVATALGDAGTEMDCVSAAIEQGGTSVQVGSNIATCGLKLVSTVVPAGTPQTVVNLLVALNAALQKVINDNKVLTTQMGAAPQFSNSFAAKDSNGKFSLGMGGKTKVKNIRKRLEQAKAKLPPPQVPVKK